MLGYIERLHNDPTFMSLSKEAKHNILEKIGASDEIAEQDMKELIAKENSVLLREVTERLTNIESRIFDRGGDQGHISQTNEQFKIILDKIDANTDSQKKDLHDGITTLHAALKAIDETMQFGLREQNKKIEGHDDRLDKHDTRIALAEKSIVTVKGEVEKLSRNFEDKATRNKDQTFQWYILLGSGLVSLIVGILIGVFA